LTTRIEVSLIDVLLAVLLCSATVQCQGALVKMDVSDLWCDADVVLIGEVLNITTHRGGKGCIYRNVVVGVVRYNKNPLNLSRVDVHVLGGVIGDIAYGAEDQPEFMVGETVLVFLRHHPEEHPHYQADGYHVVGGPQGKFTVADGVATNIVGDKLELTDSLGLPAIFVASELCIHQWGEYAENVNTTFIVTNVGEASGYFNVSISYEDPKGAVAGGYAVMDIDLEASESYAVSHVFVADRPGVYEVKADTELHREDYINPLTMNFEVLGEVVDKATRVGGGRVNLLPQLILSTILLIGLLLIGFLLIMRLVVHRRAPKAITLS
jgi:hypothetical protein